jgi:hypothetical protein
VRLCVRATCCCVRACERARASECLAGWLGGWGGWVCQAKERSLLEREGRLRAESKAKEAEEEYRALTNQLASTRLQADAVASSPVM